MSEATNDNLAEQSDSPGGDVLQRHPILSDEVYARAIDNALFRSAIPSLLLNSVKEA